MLIVRSHWIRKTMQHIPSRGRSTERSERLGLADYFVLVTGKNKNHVRALENELHVRAKAIGQRHHPVEGHELHWWVVLDFDDVVVHLLQPEARSYYDLDRLYVDCPRLDWERVPVSEDLHAAEA